MTQSDRAMLEHISVSLDSLRDDVRMMREELPVVRHRLDYHDRTAVDFQARLRLLERQQNRMYPLVLAVGAAVSGGVNWLMRRLG